MLYQPNGLLETCWETGVIRNARLSELPEFSKGKFDIRKWFADEPEDGTEIPLGVKQEPLKIEDFPAFDITDIAKFCYIGKELSDMDLTKAKFCIPPYDNCWMEFELTRSIRRGLKLGWNHNNWKDDVDGDGERWGFLISKIPFSMWVEGPEDTSYNRFLRTLAPECKWILHLHGFYGKGRHVVSMPTQAIYLREDGEILPARTEEIESAHWPVLMAISFLNCPKQIELVERKSPPRKRKDGTNTSQITYKTLVCSPVRRIIDAYLRGDRKLALHLCRGCFRVYTSARPLFGKLIGRWWWEPQVRGDVEHGEVRKNYKTNLATTS